MRNFGIICLVVLFSTQLVNAASSKIPDKNPFKGPEVAALANAVKNTPSIKVYFSGNIAGMRESCGCALNPKGGFERRFNYIKNEGVYSTQRDDVVLVDFGNMLFKSPVIKGKEEKEALENAEKMIEGTNHFKYAAVNFGALDRTLETKQLEKVLNASKFSWVSSNITPPASMASHFHKNVPMSFKNGELLILGLSGSDDHLVKLGWQFEKPADALARELKDVPANVFPIVLSDMDLTELMPLAGSVKRPIVFIGARENGGWDRPIEVGQALLLHIRPQGQDWGVFKLSAKSANAKGWFNPAEADSLAQRWDDLSTEALTLRSLASSSDKSDEMKTLEAKLTELAKYAPTEGDVAYSYDTVEMSQSFDGENETTKFMK